MGEPKKIWKFRFKTFTFASLIIKILCEQEPTEWNTTVVK
jgi:hypothetical protein